MARSIADWFDDRADASLGDRMDDEPVEQQAPWDLAGSGMTTRRTDRKALRIGRARGTRSGGTSRKAGSPSGKVSAATGDGRQQPDSSHDAASLAARIRKAAKDHPDLGNKRIARLLRDSGIDVTRAQVASVLAHPNSAWRRKPYRRTSPTATVYRVTAGAQHSRVVPTTELCTSCGVRLSVTGTCRCS